MKNNVNQLEVYYIDLNSSTSIRKKQTRDVIEQRVKDLLIPGYMFVDAYKYVKNNNEAKMLGSIKAINSSTWLNQFENAMGNSWVVRYNPLQPVSQYYVRHPKKARSNLLIEANSFNQYVYEEYCNELVNYCRSHCPAKKLKIMSNKVYVGKLVGGYKVIAAKVNADGNAIELCNLSGKGKIKEAEPLNEYVWLEPSLRSFIDGLDEGKTFSKVVVHDFSFNMSASFCKFIGADLNYAHRYEFSIEIEC